MKQVNKIFIALILFAVFFVLHLASCAVDNRIKSNPAIRSQEIVAIDARPGVKVKLGILEPAAAARGIILMLPGGNGAGVNSFRGNSGEEITLGDNFVVRMSPAFAVQGYVTVLMDTPSDQSSGMSPEFRRSAEHHADIKKIIAYLQTRYGKKPVYLVAFSMSNISAATIAAKSSDLKIAGIVFISGVWKYALSNGTIAEYLSIAYPVLIVHHQFDMCGYCQLDGTNYFYEHIKTRGRKDLVLVRGGSPYSKADVCGPMHHHGYAGREDVVVKIIIDWMDGRKIPEVIK